MRVDVSVPRVALMLPGDNQGTGLVGSSSAVTLEMLAGCRLPNVTVSKLA